MDTVDALLKRRNDDIAAEGLLVIGENYLLQKKPADALQAFKDIYEQYTEYPVIVEKARLGAGEAYERLKDIPHATEQYRMIVDNPVDLAVKQDAEERLRRLKQ